MVQQLTWEAFLALHLVGRDLVNDDRKLCGGIARGPITAINASDGRIDIRQRWVADLKDPLAPAAQQRWRFLRNETGGSVDPAYAQPPVMHPDGRIEFTIPYCGTATILPLEDRLDPTKVEGLPAQSAA
mgnify:CR=1 FL=1